MAAKLAGLHPQTLRIYEREGLIDPARNAGGIRRYSRRDISRLQEICAPTAYGLNLAGIRRILELQDLALASGDAEGIGDALVGGVGLAVDRLMWARRSLADGRRRLGHPSASRTGAGPARPISGEAAFDEPVL